MTTKSNLHTHSLYCDGKNTVEEMIQAAIAAGLESLGFSGHCHTGFPIDDCQITDVDGYFNELDEMRRKYAGVITIFKGLELESRVNG
ncbi:MAG: PHP domain-containing protein, partial [Spirochaetales bacterium]|nr:PHP domain-containing protein [Spirochaetales bacterium]